MIRGIVTNVEAWNSNPSVVHRIERALFQLFEDPMQEIFSVDPVYLIGELRNSWTDILTDYVADSLSTIPGANNFCFEGKGGFHLAWRSPPQVFLEFTYEATNYRALFLLHTDGFTQSCRLKEFTVEPGHAFEAAAQNFVERLEVYDNARRNQTAS
ncbi:hypothetical protein [Rhodospirillaceae bacterium SYSU D60014]|uniref:hypothetical protein n=1 Tax=Virgifigura deserti TaxID=2268457 RepID=UPI000E664301